MSDASKRWRCPYCDGFNDWQNEICEICGDGRRPEASAAERAPEMPKTYTPRSRPAEEPGPAPGPEPVKPAPEVKPEPAAEPPKKGGHGCLWALLILALIYGGGRLLGGEMANTVPSATAAPTRVVLPTLTVKPIPTATIMPTATPTSNAPWNFRSASHEEIERMLERYYYGEDTARGAWCAYFMNPEGTRGGFYSYDAERTGYENLAFIGTLEQDTNDKNRVTLIGALNERHTLTLQGAGTERLVVRSYDSVPIGVEVYPGTEKKDLLRKIILEVVHGVTARPTEAPGEDDFLLQIGSRGEEVRRLQQKLIKKGFLNDSADGIFGKKTEEAVRAMQSSLGLNPSGRLDHDAYEMFVNILP